MNEQSEPKKRRGRPPKSAEDRKGGNLTFRVRDGMRERLEASAKARGISISEDIEKRIERTFDFDYLMGDNETALVLRSIANAVQRFEKASGKSWVRDSETQERVHEAVSKMVDVLLGVSPTTDDRRAAGPGLPVDWDDLEYRVGFRARALDEAIKELQDYKNSKEQELKPLVAQGRARRAEKRNASKVRLMLSQVGRDELARVAGAIVNCESKTGIAVSRVQNGIVVSERGPDGVSRQVSSEWHGTELPPWSGDTEQELRAKIERMLNISPAPDDVAN